jgi:YedE family putative selenium metabolism protein
MKNFFSKRYGIIITGIIIGIIAATLQKLGNPGNMGLCVACFERDIAGALGLHQHPVLHYIRPEIIGLLLGAFLVSSLKGEFKSRGGSSTLIRFFLGFFAMLGALVFLGCPWRAFLRLAGGDLNAITGLLGLICGIYIGTLFIRKGFNLGRADLKQNKFQGMIMPIVMVVLLLMAVFQFKPGSITDKLPAHAPLLVSLIAGLIIGVLAQRSRFCTMGSIRDIFIVKDFHLFSGVLAFALSAFVMNLLYGQFKIGFTGQPAAHTRHLWNFLGMTLSGLSFALAGGCPGRQLILSGEGNTDSGIFVFGMITGAAFSHNFNLASSGKGIGPFGAYGVLLGLAFCLVTGFLMLQKRK